MLVANRSRYLPRQQPMTPIAWKWRRLQPPRDGATVEVIVPLYPAPEAIHVRMPADLPKLERHPERERASELRRKAREREARAAAEGEIVSTPHLLGSRRVRGRTRV